MSQKKRTRGYRYMSLYKCFNVRMIIHCLGRKLGHKQTEDSTLLLLSLLRGLVSLRYESYLRTTVWFCD